MSGAAARRDRAWLLAALWHAMQNAVGGSFLFPMVQGADQERLGVILSVVYWLAAVIVLVVDRKRLAQEPDGRRGAAG